jgi:hypothetical protein
MGEKMSEIQTVVYPERDEDRRRILGLMFGLSKTAVNKFSVEELESIALKRNYISKTGKRGLSEPEKQSFSLPRISTKHSGAKINGK